MAQAFLRTTVHVVLNEMRLPTLWPVGKSAKREKMHYRRKVRAVKLFKCRLLEQKCCTWRVELSTLAEWTKQQ